MGAAGAVNIIHRGELKKAADPEVTPGVDRRIR